MVVIACKLYLVKGLVECIEEVACDYEDEDTATMTLISWSLREWLGFASTDSDAIVDGLQERCGILLFMSASIPRVV